jgi:hypothetical protein
LSLVTLSFVLTFLHFFVRTCHLHFSVIPHLPFLSRTPTTCASEQANDHNHCFAVTGRKYDSMPSSNSRKIIPYQLSHPNRMLNNQLIPSRPFHANLLVPFDQPTFPALLNKPTISTRITRNGSRLIALNQILLRGMTREIEIDKTAAS